MDGENPNAVRIAVREAPYSQFSGRREPSVVQFPTRSNGKSLMVEQNEFHFDYVFPATISQDEMYQALIQPLVDKFLEGYPCTALAYGQTGTGKSYSMGMAPPDKPEHMGVLPRVLADILERVTARQENHKNPVLVYASFIEIYNEKPFDLLSSRPHMPMVAARCRQCTCLPLHSQEDLQDILELGIRNRRVRATNMNSNSSRSHAIVTIHVKSDTHHCRMNIVDLAGSEGVRRTGHEGVARQEGVNINLGLLSINKVVMAMAAGHPLIPYRDSVLTAVLQESLTAQAYLTFLACISPHRCDLSETLSTLRFGSGAKKLRLNPLQVARQKQSLAARTPHVFRQVLSTSTAIKSRAANRTIPATPLDGELRRSRSELDMTTKAKKRARKLLEQEETTLETSSVRIVDIDQGRDLMTPLKVEPRQPSNLHSTAMAMFEETESEEPSRVQQPMNPSTARYQLFNTIISPIRLRPSGSQREVSRKQPTKKRTLPLLLQESLRRSERLANRLRLQREPVTAVEVKTETVTQLPLVDDGPHNNERMDENRVRMFLDQLNRNVTELKKIPGIGPKTATSLVIYRSDLGGFHNLGEVKSLPLWRGNQWKKICDLNHLLT
ncbi:kinesin-like protein Nod [Drosophila erecta]|uniref:Kinesin motor domain-containing protein n=1 Tax=Drosophila erecta TaxID=7220 RepID=B3NUB3_DROER|nr:kinesin-like protein Nod [Drosophila erecta]EDV46028.1 uncharacterized protein Dere_GG18431 [Drosophila erecta]